MARSASVSPSGSPSRHTHTPSASPAPVAGPSRLTKSEVASYLGIVHDLEGFERSDLSTKLSKPVSRFWGNDQHGPSGREYEAEMEVDGEGEGEGEEIDLSDTERSRSRSRTRTGTGTRSESGPHRVDGPSFAPAYQGADGLTTSGKPRKMYADGKKRKRREVRWDERESTRWPLSLSELPDQGSRSGTASGQGHAQGQGLGPSNPFAQEVLEELITSFASAYVRHNRLKLIPAQLEDKGERPSAGTVDPDPKRGWDVDLEPRLPEDLIPSTMEMIDQVLVNLAACRPAEVGRKRKAMGVVDWPGLVAVAGLTPQLRDIAQKANTRLRDVYKAEGEDGLSHRLGVLRSTHSHSTPGVTASTQGSALDDLYAPVIPKKDTAIRKHQSKAEQEKREEKRRLKAERKAAKEGGR